MAVYYHKVVDLGNLGSEVNWGINISNIGNKISYSKTAVKKDFIPTNLRIGASIKMNFDDYNSLSVMMDLNKLLVPTPPVYDTTADGYPKYDSVTGNLVIAKGMNPECQPGSGDDPVMV